MAQSDAIESYAGEEQVLRGLRDMCMKLMWHFAFEGGTRAATTGPRKRKEAWELAGKMLLLAGSCYVPWQNIHVGFVVCSLMCEMQYRKLFFYLENMGFCESHGS